MLIWKKTETRVTSLKSDHYRQIELFYGVAEFLRTDKARYDWWAMTFKLGHGSSGPYGQEWFTSVGSLCLIICLSGPIFVCFSFLLPDSSVSTWSLSVEWVGMAAVSNGGETSGADNIIPKARFLTHWWWWKARATGLVRGPLSDARRLAGNSSQSAFQLPLIQLPTYSPRMSVEATLLNPAIHVRTRTGAR